MKLESLSAKTTAGSGAALMRVLIVSTWDDLAIEIVAYEAEQFSIHINNDLEGNKFSTIQRRCTELDFGAFYIKSALVLDTERCQSRLFITLLLY
ncbi:MAG: hypothetical protein IPP97_28245 [Candidatus Obscuribacter sp.]|nr:hypothetical protein [Candidatus Obscuribacter sp.]